MGHKWEDYERAVEKGPIEILVKSFFGAVIFGVIVWGVLFFVGAFTDTAEVAKKEFSAQSALRKYEWFKDAAAQLEKKQNDIRVFEGRRRSLFEAYANTPRREWARVDSEALNTIDAEIAGIKSSYNQLAAEYNAASSKFNWSFAQGSVPQTFQQMAGE